MADDLKVLGFVATLGNTAVSAASAAWSKSKSYVSPSITSAVEERASPLVASAADAAGGALVSLDQKVDAAVGLATKLYSSSTKELSDQVVKQKAFHEANLAHYKAAREAYLRKIEEAVDYLKTAGVSGAARAAAEKVALRVEDAKKASTSAGAYLQGAAAGAATGALDRVFEAWTALASQPAVAKLLEAAAPRVERARAAYLQAHDAVAGSPAYAKAVEHSIAAVAAVQASAPFKAAAARLYPAVAPFDPAIKTIAGSPYVAAAVDHLRPIAAGGKK